MVVDKQGYILGREKTSMNELELSLKHKEQQEVIRMLEGALSRDPLLFCDLCRHPFEPMGCITTQLVSLLIRIKHHIQEREERETLCLDPLCIAAGPLRPKHMHPVSKGE